MEKIISRFLAISLPDEVRTELVRKSLHMLIAVVPVMASINLPVTFAMLCCGTLLYSYAEMIRCSGGSVWIISRITELAARGRDKDSFILGPVTLGIGALLALLVYPAPAATIAIFALAFGDSFSSIIGKSFGRIKIPFTNGKSFAGSFACFFSVFIVSYYMTRDYRTAVIIGLSASALEALPLKDLDNIILPLGTGFIASQIITLPVSIPF